MKSFIKKTYVMLANGKSKMFGESVLHIRKLENEKIFCLLEEIGLTKDDVCFARKEIGQIRA